MTSEKVEGFSAAELRAEVAELRKEVAELKGALPRPVPKGESGYRVPDYTANFSMPAAALREMLNEAGEGVLAELRADAGRAERGRLPLVGGATVRGRGGEKVRLWACPRERRRSGWLSVLRMRWPRMGRCMANRERRRNDGHADAATKGGSEMKPNDEKWTRDDILRMLLAPRPKPAPKSAEQKAQEAWKQPLAATLKAEKQSCERALRAKEDALREAQLNHQREEYHRRAEQINHSAIELAYAAQQAEALASRRYDPCGLCGEPNYKSRRDD